MYANMAKRQGLSAPVFSTILPVSTGNTEPGDPLFTLPTLPSIVPFSTPLPIVPLTSTNLSAISTTSTLNLTTPSSTTTSTTSTTSSTPTPTSTFSPTPVEVITTATLTAIPTPTTSTVAASTHQSFLQNKPLAGTVFGLIAFFALLLLFVVIAWALRKARRRDKLASLSFDPDITSDAYGGLTEPASGSGHGAGSGSTTGHELFYEQTMHPNYGQSPYPVVPEPEMTYMPQQPQGYPYGQGPPFRQQGWAQPASVYAPPSSLLPGYIPAPQAQYSYGATVPQNRYMPSTKDTLPPLPVSDPEESPNTPPSPITKTAAETSSTGAPSRIPIASPLPDTFGSDHPSRRDSSELDAQFWGRTLNLKVANA